MEEIILGSGELGSQENQKYYDSNIYWVRNDIQSIRGSFIKLGYHLWEIKKCEIYKVYGYEDFYEFCDNNFHLTGSSVRRYIQLWNAFGEYRDGKIKMNIAEEYESYSYSQLCEMLPLMDEERKQIKPDMTISQIRDIKSKLKEKKCATSHKPEPDEASDSFVNETESEVQNKLVTIDSPYQEELYQKEKKASQEYEELMDNCIYAVSAILAYLELEHYEKVKEELISLRSDLITCLSLYGR